MGFIITAQFKPAFCETVHRTVSCQIIDLEKATAGSNPLKHKKNTDHKVGAFCGRGDWIWTSGPYVPNVVLYQTEPHLEVFTFPERFTIIAQNVPEVKKNFWKSYKNWTFLLFYIE